MRSPLPQAASQPPFIDIGVSNPAALQKLREALLSSTRQDLAELRALMDRPDAGGLGKLFHRIRGSAALMRNTYLSDLCKHTEAQKGGSEGLLELAGMVEDELLRISDSFGQ
ncbi:MAG: Hpt domain-containing protein [Pseudomonas sp.]